MMGSKPFEVDKDIGTVNAILADRIHALVEFPQIDSSKLIHPGDSDELAGIAMQEMRQSRFENRKAYYLKHRIDDQMTWYKKKGNLNQKAAKISLLCVVAIYLLAIGTSAVQLHTPFIKGQVLWASEPLLVLAASLLGYAQAKRFSELSASYTLTALEIKKLRAGFLPIQNEEAFILYVNEAENAFSREHTQWIARVI